jgi:hypothetical protein
VLFTRYCWDDQYKEDGVGEPCSSHEGDEKRVNGNPEGKDHLGGIDEKIIL